MSQQPHPSDGASPLQIKSKSVFSSSAAAAAPKAASASNVTPLKKPAGDMPVDVVIGGSFASLGGGSSLCKHLLDEYFKRVRDIFEVYKSQIVQFVKYGALRESLLERGMIQQEEDAKICEEEDEAGKMAALLKILNKRMWGLENLITVLIEVNVDSWLVEEMFHKYVFYIVNEIKRLKNGSLCHCFSKDQKSLLGSTIDKFFETCDSWLYSIGTSLGFLTLTIHGSTSSLQPISDLLPVNRAKAGQKSFSRVEMSRANITTTTTSNAAKSEKSPTEGLGVELLNCQPSATLTKPSDRSTTKDDQSHKDVSNDDSNNSHDLIKTRDKQHNSDPTCETPQEPNGSLGKPDFHQEGRQPPKKTHNKNNNSRLKDYRKRLKVKIPKMDVTAHESSLEIHGSEAVPQEINVMVLPANSDLDSSQPSPAKAAVRSWFTLHSFSNGSLNNFSIDSQPPSSSSAGSSSSFNFKISGQVPETIRSMIQDRRLSQPTFKDTPGHRDKCVSVPALPALMCPNEVADSQVPAPAASPTANLSDAITTMEENPQEVVVEVEQEVEPIVIDVEQSPVPPVEIAPEVTSITSTVETVPQVVEEMDVPPLVTADIPNAATTTEASTVELPPIPADAPQIIEVEPKSIVSEKTEDTPTTELNSVPVPTTPAGPIKKPKPPVVELPKLPAPASVSIRRSVRRQSKPKESEDINKANKLPVVPSTPRNKPVRSIPVTIKPLTPAGSFETFGFAGDRLKPRKDLNISIMSSRSNTENSFSKIPGFRGRAVSNAPNVVPNLPQRTPSRIALQNANRPFLNAPRTEPLKIKIGPRTSLQKGNGINNDKIELKSDAEMNQANKRKDVGTVVNKAEKPARVPTVGSMLNSTNNGVSTPSRKSTEVKIVQKAAVKPRIQTNSKLEERRKAAAPPPLPIPKPPLQEKPFKKSEKSQRKKSTSELILSNSMASRKSRPVDVLSKVVQSYVLHGREKTLSLPNILLLTTSNGALRSCHFLNVKLRRYKSLVFQPAVKKLSCSVKPVQSRVNRKSIAHVRSSQVLQSSSNNPSVSLFSIPADPRARKLVHATSQTEVSMKNEKGVFKPAKSTPNPTRRLPLASRPAAKSSSVANGTNPPKPKTLPAPPPSSASSKLPSRSSRPPAPAKSAIPSKRPLGPAKTPGPTPERFSQFSVDTYNFQQWSNQWIAKKTSTSRLPTKK